MRLGNLYTQACTIALGFHYICNMVNPSGIYGHKTDKTESVKRLFDRYYRPLVMFATEFTGEIEESKDIVQDFFLRLWREDYLERVDPDRLSSYMYTAVRNACRSQMAKKDPLKRGVEINDFDIPVEWVASIDEEVISDAGRLLERMPPRVREAMEYVIINDYSYKETAAAMGVSVNTIKFLLKDGMKRCRNISVLMALLMLIRLG